MANANTEPISLLFPVLAALEHKALGLQIFKNNRLTKQQFHILKTSNIRDAISSFSTVRLALYWSNALSSQLKLKKKNKIKKQPQTTKTPKHLVEKH